MKLIYVSCKFGGDKKRVEYCENVIKELIKRDRESGINDRIYVSPLHTFGWLFNDVPYEEGLDWCLDLLSKCDTMIVLEDFETSRGCNVEIGYCKSKGIPIVYLNDMI